jgi:hypothetical protein
LHWLCRLHSAPICPVLSSRSATAWKIWRKRPKEFDSLKRQLLDAKGDAVAITAALRGVGGYGKTTLAKALAHDPDIGMCYPGRHVGLLPCL